MDFSEFLTDVLSGCLREIVPSHGLDGEVLPTWERRRIEALIRELNVEGDKAEALVRAELEKIQARNALLAERRRLALETQQVPGMPENELHDPIADDPRIRKWLDEAEREAHEAAKPFGRGACHIRWSVMQRLMQERHGITWFTPPEMNPTVLYD